MMTKVFVAGANGQVGRLVIETLLTNDCEAVGGYRDPASQARGDTAQYQAVHFDLTDSINTLAKIMKGCDAVIFAAGSGGKNLLAVDLDGAVKTMMAAQQAGITRFIQLSALNVQDRRFWQKSGINDYYIAKYYADEWLKTRTTLDWVIVEPTALTNDDGTGKITLKPKGKTQISRQDVATVLVEAVNSDLHHQEIAIASGDVPIAQAF